MIGQPKSSDTAKAALVIGLLALAKSYNLTKTPPAIVTAGTLTPNTVDLLVAHFEEEIDGDSELARNLSPYLTSFSEFPFSTDYIGNSLVTKPYRRIGLRLYLNPDINMAGAEDVLKFYAQLYLGATGTSVLFASDLILDIPNTPTRLFDTGLFDLANTLAPYNTDHLSPFVDFVSAGIVAVNTGVGPQRITGTLTIYAEDVSP